MPKTGKVYPDWVQEYRTRGTTVKKKGEKYYLYKRTSKRVPGKKYPQPVDTYIGVITPEGVIRSDKKKVTLTNASVKEFGFSRAVELLCPQSWKDPLGKAWQESLAGSSGLHHPEGVGRILYSHRTWDCRGTGAPYTVWRPEKFPDTPDAKRIWC